MANTNLKGGSKVKAIVTGLVMGFVIVTAVVDIYKTAVNRTHSMRVSASRVLNDAEANSATTALAAVGL